MQAPGKRSADGLSGEEALSIGRSRYTAQARYNLRTEASAAIANCRGRSTLMENHVTKKTKMTAEEAATLIFTIRNMVLVQLASTQIEIVTIDLCGGDLNSKNSEMLLEDREVLITELIAAHQAYEAAERRVISNLT